MYLRWKRRQLKPDRDTKQPRVLLSAMLVESRRHILDGKPRQRVVRYLGSIQDVHLTGDQAMRSCNRFWVAVEWHLNDLSRLSAEQRSAIETALLRVVPRPTPDELIAHDETARQDFDLSLIHI